MQLYQIDAFASSLFQGNPAAVCPLDAWLPDQLMQAIAEENNLAETAFFIPAEDGFHIRWFTPTVEVDLCGHATLAAAFVLFEELGYAEKSITFYSRSGKLTVTKEKDFMVLDFPVQPPEPCAVPEAIAQAFGDRVQACFKAEDYLVVLKQESDVATAVPDLNLLKKLDLRGVIISAASERYDFVCRFFAPNYGIDEDPVTGSAFTQLTPYWAEVLGKEKLSAKQLSLRGGEVGCELKGERVLIKGMARKYLQGTIALKADHY